MKKKSTIYNMHGFTLVELMVVVLLTAIAVMAIYRGYTAFSISADAQEQVIEMQQNLRIGMQWLEKDLRRAEMNEEDDDVAGFYIHKKLFDKGLLSHDPPAPGSRLSPGPANISFTMDLGGANLTTSDEDTSDGRIPGDGDMKDDDEWITYRLADLDGDGRQELVKTDENENQGNPDDTPLDQTIITNVDALDFVYLDIAGDVLPFNASDVLDETDLKDIRTIQACLVVRTTNDDLRYINTESYENINPDGAETIYTAPGDHYRRRVFCKEIKIRNAGL